MRLSASHFSNRHACHCMFLFRQTELLGRKPFTEIWEWVSHVVIGPYLVYFERYFSNRELHFMRYLYEFLKRLSLKTGLKTFSNRASLLEIDVTRTHLETNSFLARAPGQEASEGQRGWIEALSHIGFHKSWGFRVSLVSHTGWVFQKAS